MAHILHIDQRLHKQPAVLNQVFYVVGYFFYSMGWIQPMGTIRPPHALCVSARSRRHGPCQTCKKLEIFSAKIEDKLAFIASWTVCIVVVLCEESEAICREGLSWHVSYHETSRDPCVDPSRVFLTSSRRYQLALRSTNTHEYRTRTKYYEYYKVDCFRLPQGVNEHHKFVKGRR